MLRLAPETANQHSRRIAASRRDGDEDQEAPVPPAVEDVARHYDQQVLPAQRPEHEPVETEYYRQEDQELKRIEQHRKKRTRNKLTI